MKSENCGSPLWFLYTDEDYGGRVSGNFPGCGSGTGWPGGSGRGFPGGVLIELGSWPRASRSEGRDWFLAWQPATTHSRAVKSVFRMFNPSLSGSLLRAGSL